MLQLLAPLLVSAGLLLAPHLPAGYILRYRPSPGQTATFHVSVEAQGLQTFQGETRPVRFRAQLEVREETRRVEPDGSFWLLVTGRALHVEDPTGTFGSGDRARWPVVLMHVSPRGEVLETKPETSGGRGGMFSRAFARAMLLPLPVVLPERGVRVGDTWEWRRGGARQENHLTGITPGNPLTARISSHGRAPLRLEEVSPRLGLTTTVTGRMEQRSEAELLLPSGLTSLQQGEIHLATRGRIALRLASETKSFPLAGDIRLRFSIKLTGLDGRPATSSQAEGGKCNKQEPRPSPPS